MKTLHEHKIEGYTSIGYEAITDDGHAATLAYIPYNRKYVKLAEIEAGKTKGSIILSGKELTTLINRVELLKRSNKQKGKKFIK